MDYARALRSSTKRIADLGYEIDDTGNQAYKLMLNLNDLIISDIDECAQKSYTCDVNANCKNTVGSYDCQCSQGYSGNGKTCTGMHIAFTKSLTAIYKQKIEVIERRKICSEVNRDFLMVCPDIWYLRTR